MSTELIYTAANWTMNSSVFNPSTGGILTFQNFSKLNDLMIITNVCDNWNFTLIGLVTILFAAHVTRNILRRIKKKKVLSKNQQVIYEKMDEYAQTWETIIIGLVFVLTVYHLFW